MFFGEVICQCAHDMIGWFTLHDSLLVCIVRLDTGVMTLLIAGTPGVMFQFEIEVCSVSVFDYRVRLWWCRVLSVVLLWIKSPRVKR